ncbi:MAG: efflux RND transporter periplasmic adaptor subunit [Proteobacteria bacterium]|nr:efflux RND transporter periplasmic adaptor subunit [Pseudomonadota bacterium]
MIFKKPWFWIVLVLILVGGGGYLFVQKQAAAAKQRIATAKAHPIETPYATIASGKADVEGGIINVAARRGGIVQQVLVQEGDHVTKNQVLARQEDQDARLALMTAQSQLAQARAQIPLTEVQIASAKREYARLARLAPTSFVAQQKLDQAQDAVRQAEAQQATNRAAIATAQAAVNQSRYNLDLTVIRAPVDGVIVRRYANPGAGASTLNVSNMFDLEPATGRIVRAEIVESALPGVSVGQEVEITPEADASKVYVGHVIRRAALFGARKLQSDDPNERSDERVVEVVVSADTAPFLIGQRVLVKFMKAGFKAGEKHTAPAAAPKAG